MRQTTRTMWLWGMAALIACAGVACKKKDDAGGASGGGTGDKTVTVAFITNGTDPFWNLAEVGCRDAEKKFNVKCIYYAPPNNSADEQLRKLEELSVQKVSGVAITPMDPANQTDAINKAAEKMNLICHDSDAPASKRLFYLGTSNVEAGRHLGRLVKEALPEGGKIMIFVGKIDVLNAQERRQGLLEILKDEPKYVVLDTMVDQGDYSKAKANAEDALTKHPDLACMVGLWGLNGPQCRLAAQGAGRLGKVKIIAFDHFDDTLTGIEKGEIYATVVQQPYEFGYKSVEYLAMLARGQKDQIKIPANGIIDVPTLIVKKENVAEYRAKVKTLGGSK